MFESQISKREEMAVAKEASDRASEEEGLERLLGLPEGDHASLLSLRIPRKQNHGGGAQAFDHSRWRDNATDPGTSEERLHILLEHRFRRCLFISGTFVAEGEDELIFFKFEIFTFEKSEFSDLEMFETCKKIEKIFFFFLSKFSKVLKFRILFF